MKLLVGAWNKPNRIVKDNVVEARMKTLAKRYKCPCDYLCCSRVREIPLSINDIGHTLKCVVLGGHMNKYENSRAGYNVFVNSDTGVCSVKVAEYKKGKKVCTIDINYAYGMPICCAIYPFVLLPNSKDDTLKLVLDSNCIYTAKLLQDRIIYLTTKEIKHIPLLNSYLEYIKKSTNRFKPKVHYVEGTYQEFYVPIMDTEIRGPIVFEEKPKVVLPAIGKRMPLPPEYERYRKIIKEPVPTKPLVTVNRYGVDGSDVDRINVPLENGNTISYIVLMDAFTLYTPEGHKQHPAQKEIAQFFQNIAMELNVDDAFRTESEEPNETVKYIKTVAKQNKWNLKLPKKEEQK